MKNIIRNFSIVTSLVALSFTGCNDDAADNNPSNSGTASYSLKEITAFPGQGRQSAVAFTIGDQGYVGLGGNYPKVFQDFYKFNASNESWTPIANFGGQARRSATAFVIDGIAYVGGGVNEDGAGFTVLYDFWKYNPSSDKWSQIADMPEGSDSKAGSETSSFVINSKGYVMESGTGNVYEYDPTSDKWTTKGAFPGSDRTSAAAFTIGSKGYFGTGTEGGLGGSRFSDFWEYNASNDTWKRLSDFSGDSRNGAVGFSIGNYGFIGTGNNFSREYGDFFRYDPDNDTWTEVDKGDLFERSSMVSFVIGNDAYIGTGTTATKSFYKFTSD